MNYKDSGVDLEAGRSFVETLKHKAPSIGGFGGMFEVPRGYEEPVLVSGTDGVGTKMNICRVARDKWGNSFTYTLLDSKDLKL